MHHHQPIHAACPQLMNSAVFLRRRRLRRTFAALGAALMMTAIARV